MHVRRSATRCRRRHAWLGLGLGFRVRVRVRARARARGRARVGGLVEEDAELVATANYAVPVVGVVELGAHLVRG